MSHIKIGVVEDEIIIADSLCAMLTGLGYTVPEPAASYAEAVGMIEEEKPDLLLIDIQIKGKRDGIELAQKVRATYGIPFIFLTANADTATVQRAKLTQPNAYLLKPFTPEDLYTAIEVCLHNVAQRTATQSASLPTTDFVINKALFIKNGQAFHKVQFTDILYLESEHVYVQVHTIQKKYLVRAALQQYLAHFDERVFQRIHRSYVVNTERIESITPEYVIINNTRLPIGKMYQEDLFKRLQID